MNWLKSNKLSLNDDKTKVMVFDDIQECDKIEVVLDYCSIIIEEEKVRSKKYLGLVLDHKLNFQAHIEYIKKKIAKRIGAMYKSKNLLPLKYRKMFANSLMLPYFDYLDIIWNKTYKTNLNELDILYKLIWLKAPTIIIAHYLVPVCKLNNLWTHKSKLKTPINAP